MTNIIWLVYNCICYGANSFDTCVIHTPFVVVSLILIDLGMSILMFRPLTHFTYLFFISWVITFFKGILKSQRFQNSILPINNTGDINPNGSHLEAKVLSTFLLIELRLSVSISNLIVSLCLSQFKSSFFASFDFVRRCYFEKNNSVWELSSLLSKFG